MNFLKSLEEVTLFVVFGWEAKIIHLYFYTNDHIATRLIFINSAFRVWLSKLGELCYFKSLLARQPVVISALLCLNNSFYLFEVQLRSKVTKDCFVGPFCNVNIAFHWKFETFNKENEKYEGTSQLSISWGSSPQKAVPLKQVTIQAFRI